LKKCNKVKISKNPNEMKFKLCFFLATIDLQEWAKDVLEQYVTEPRTSTKNHLVTIAFHFLDQGRGLAGAGIVGRERTEDGIDGVERMAEEANLLAFGLGGLRRKSSTYTSTQERGLVGTNVVSKEVVFARQQSIEGRCEAGAG
jgi:hypothetical protein